MNPRPLLEEVVSLAERNTRSRRKNRELEDFDEEVLYIPLRSYLTEKRPDPEHLKWAVSELLRSPDAFRRRVGLELLEAASVSTSELIEPLRAAFNSEVVESGLLPLFAGRLADWGVKGAARDILRKLITVNASEQADHDKKRHLIRTLSEAAYVLDQALGVDPVLAFIRNDMREEKIGFYSSTAVLLANILLRARAGTLHVVDPLLLAIRAEGDRPLADYFISEFISGLERVRMVVPLHDSISVRTRVRESLSRSNDERA